MRLGLIEYDCWMNNQKVCGELKTVCYSKLGYAEFSEAEREPHIDMYKSLTSEGDFK